MAPKIRVFLVNSESRADHKVFIVNADNRQLNHQLIAGGQIVKSESQADLKLFIVNAENRASIKITQKNFPK